MAIDTRNKRASALAFDQPFDCAPPLPDGSLASQADRQMLAGSYAGILAAVSSGAPEPISAVCDDAELSITFDRAVSIGAGGNGGFVLTGTAGAVTLTYASGSGTDTLVYTLSRTGGNHETFSLAYTQPGNGVEDAFGEDVASFSGLSVANTSTVDILAPTLQSATIAKGGVLLTLRFSEAIVVGAGGNGGFALTASGGAVTATFVQAGGPVATFSLSRAVDPSETVTLDYTQPGNGIEDLAGNDLASIAARAVTFQSSAVILQLSRALRRR